MDGLPEIPGLIFEPPASEEALAALERRLGRGLPAAFRRLLLLADGASLSGGILIYGTDLVEERNATWEVAIYAPGYLAIGDTGGGEAILIRDDGSDPRLFLVDTGAMTEDMMRPISPGLGEWLGGGLEIPDD